MSNISLTYKFKDYLSECVITVLLFFLLINGVGFPIDKLFMVTLLGYLFFFTFFQIQFSLISLAIIYFWLFAAFASSMYNVTLKPMIFYPVFGLIFIFSINRIDWIRTFAKTLLVYIYLCFLLGVLAYLIEPNIGVTSLADKGLPFILPFKGLNSTVQSFGSLCVLWLILNFELADNKYGWNFVIVILTIFLTFNRSSYLFSFIILAIYNRKFLWAVSVFMVLGFIAFFEQISDFLLNMGTLQSRSELLQGFYLSYWNDNSLLGYLFGNGNNFYSPEIVAMVKWDHRPDIENGYAMLLHTYGFIGLFGYFTCSILFLINSFFYKKAYKLTIALFYYLFITQFFTQEFVTNIYYLFIASIFSLIYFKNENSSCQCNN
ncbi:hypothetical protein [Echinicola pacifica]|uniref:hypothetical protein n=1 Tax=Echinicola pacifica TaxID=346377 RepID=UPI0003A716E5|nr:hypothetical protein [Echinicola pacifica]